MSDRPVIAIVHAPWSRERAANVERIAAALSTIASSVRVVCDDKREGVWPTCIRALSWCASETRGHAIVVQDDASIGEHSAANIERALRRLPTGELASMFTGRAEACARARRLGCGWVYGPDCYHAACGVVPASRVDDLLRWQRDHVLDEYPHDDNRIGLWARAMGLGCWLTAERLVGHGHYRSLLRHRFPEVAPYDAPFDPGPLPDMPPVIVGATVQAWRALMAPVTWTSRF